MRLSQLSSFTFGLGSKLFGSDSPRVGRQRLNCKFSPYFNSDWSSWPYTLAKAKSRPQRSPARYKQLCARFFCCAHRAGRVGNVHVMVERFRATSLRHNVCRPLSQVGQRTRGTYCRTLFQVSRVITSTTPWFVQLYIHFLF